MLRFDEKSVSNGGYKIYKSETNLNFDFLSWRHFSYWDKHESSNSRSSSNKPEIKKKINKELILRFLYNNNSGLTRKL